MNNHSIHRRSSSRARAAALLAPIVAVVGSAAAQLPAHQTPPEMEGVGITEMLGDRVPLELTFTDESGETVELGSFFQPGKPVILTLNYYTCPQLCHQTLNGLVDGLRDLEWTAGEQFTIVTVSINPKETSQQARAFGNAYLSRYDREAADENRGWRFLVGTQENIAKLADAIGYGYRYDPKSGDYAHASSITFVTPDGGISRYINSLIFEPRDLRLALVESSEGAIGSRMDRILLLTCFQWDPDSNSYGPVAWKIMRTGAAFTVLVLGMGLFVLWLRGSRHETNYGQIATQD